MGRLSILIAIGLGGACGALMRYGIGRWFPARTDGFPTGTFVANMVGCLVIGFCLVKMGDRVPEAVRLGIVVGLIGSLTTFSTFAMESLMLAGSRSFATASLNIVASVTCGLAAAWLGMMLGQILK